MALKQKEDILLVAAENIPSELKELPQFLLWRAEWDEQRKQFDKIPYQLNGRRASSTDSRTWGSFEQVFNEYEESGKYDGIGFVLTKTDNFVCVDIDDLQSVDELNPLAQEIVNMSYAEISPSGRGVHVWFRHQLDRERHKNKNAETGYEVYDSGRYLTVTGESLNDLPINPGGEKLNLFLDKVLKREQAEIQPITKEPGYGKAAFPESEIIRIACSNHKSGESIKRLLYGGWEERYHGDYSDADYALMDHLAYWCNCDPAMMDSIFRKSSLMRDKWDRPQNGTTYGNEEIQKAIRKCRNTFNPPKSEEEKQHDWWQVNSNGTRSFLHQVLAKEVMKKYYIVRYPNPHSDLYYFNSKKGIYEQDRSGRQINGIIRSFDDELKTGQVKETYNYIQDMSKIVGKINDKYIALKNGILNFETFQLELFNPNMFILQKISVDYKPNAYDSFVESTLEKVTQGHKPSIENIKEIFACVLSPGVLVPKIHYLLGRSAHNGKSSILNLIHQTFNKDGGNISAVTPQKLASSTFAGASVYGKLANIVDDNPQSLIEDSGLLKTIVTGGFAEIERKGRDSETVRLNTTMIIASNHFPNLNESGNAINRRLNIIPFDHNFSLDPDCLPDEESMRLTASESAAEYVLKIAIDTLKRMLNDSSSDKLTPNEKVQEVTAAFAEHNDPLEDYFYEFDEQYFNEMPGSRALEDYEDWCKANRIPPLETKRYKEVVCGKYNLEWKTKKIKYNGEWKSFKGFKSKNV